MAINYEEPIKIKVEVAPSFTKAALNKCLFLTDEHKSGSSSEESEIKVFMNQADVSEYYGNNTKIAKAIEFFLGQKQYPAKQPLIPTFFTVLSIKKEGISKEKVVEALNTLATGAEYYAIASVLEDGVLSEGDLNSFLNSNRKILFYTNKTGTTSENIRSDRSIGIYNPSFDEKQEIAYMATVVTAGAGSKVDMNILNMCSTVANGGKKQELTSQNLNFTEKRTSKEYVVVRTGIATDGTSIDETTAMDCIIYNLIDNIEITMAEKGFKQDSRGYSLLEDRLNAVMGEMYNMELIADNNGQADYKITPITQTATERQLKTIRPKIVFRLADWAKLVELTLERSFKEVVE